MDTFAIVFPASGFSADFSLREPALYCPETDILTVKIRPSNLSVLSPIIVELVQRQIRYLSDPSAEYKFSVVIDGREFSGCFIKSCDYGDNTVEFKVTPTCKDVK